MAAGRGHWSEGPSSPMADQGASEQSASRADARMRGLEGAVFVRASLTGNGSPKPGGDEMLKAWAKLRPGLGKLKGN